MCHSLDYRKGAVLVFISLYIGSLCRAKADLICHCLNNEPCNKSNGFCVAGCQKGWCGPGCQVGNLALGKSAAQSSTYDDEGWQNTADLAVDGWTPPADSHSSAFCSHTLPRSAERPWWYVNLSDTQDVFVIQTVTISSRRGPKAARLQRFIILYANETTDPPNPKTWRVCEYQAIQPNTVSTYSCQGFAVGMKVAVYLDSGTPENILTLCEVSVYGYRYSECTSGYDGPGCLLRDCSSDVCRNTAGTSCGPFGGCQFTVCPDDRFAPPDCLATLPKLMDAPWLVTATCDHVKIFASHLQIQGDLAATALIITAHSTDDLLIFRDHRKIAASSMVDGRIAVAANRTYSLWATPEVCMKDSTCSNESSGICSNVNCKLGPSTRIAAVRTNSRQYDLQNNGTCLFVTTALTALTCDMPVSLKVRCENITAQSERGINNEAVLCGLNRGVDYSCTVVATLSNGVTDTYSTKVLIRDNGAFGSIPVVAAGGALGGAVLTTTVVTSILRNLIRKKLQILKTKITGLQLRRIIQHLHQIRNRFKGDDSKFGGISENSDAASTATRRNALVSTTEPGWDEIVQVHRTPDAGNLEPEASSVETKGKSFLPESNVPHFSGTDSAALLQKLRQPNIAAISSKVLGLLPSREDHQSSSGTNPVGKARNMLKNILS